ncbi:MAG: fibronectin type III domain-containing protein [Desulfobacteraceae bacterium]|nr:fibronectin type III domain-containing protein [Desulfobacteraceae bacterium]
MRKKIGIIGLSLVSFLFLHCPHGYAKTVTWTASAGIVDGYRIYYGTDPNSLTETMDIGNVTNYSLDNLTLTEGTTYYFRLKAVNEVGESDFADNTVVWTPGDYTPPLPPEGMAAERCTQ